MTVPSNFHTHTIFCDGKDTPEEIVEKAISLGCPMLGFSGHSFVPSDSEGCMSPENEMKYFETVQSLKERYQEKIHIFIGIEQDTHSSSSNFAYDYLIGSVHYVEKNGRLFAVDIGKEELKFVAESVYGGDFYALAEDYYREVGQVYKKTHCQIVGHFDLLSKYNENKEFFDPSHPRYQLAWRGALAALAGTPVCIEINTGAMANGYRNEPYPSYEILSVLSAQGFPLLFSSDCHDKENLLFGYEKVKDFCTIESPIHLC